MYRLVLHLPFDITLVHRIVFPSLELAQVGLRMLPAGFEITQAQAYPKGYIEVPFDNPKQRRPDTMKPEEYIAFETARKLPLEPGCTVTVPIFGFRRGTVVEVGPNGDIVVDMEEEQENVTLPRNAVLRVA